MATMIWTKITILACIVAATFSLRGVRRLPSDYGLNVKELIEKNGYPFENHTVITEDGYILEIHRIPPKTSKASRLPVLIVHGALSSSADYVNTGKGNSLAFILADEGYDVWLGNCRGNTWSRKHVKLDPDFDKKEFWDFSFQELAAYDVPTFIDYTLNVTRKAQLYYIGHSQGTASFFAALADKPEYNEKIQFMSALGPAAYIDHTKMGFLQFLAKYTEQVEAIVERHQFYEFLPYNSWYKTMGGVFCNDGSPLQEVCASIIYLMAGYSPHQLNKTLIPVYGSNAPAGSAVKQWRHFAQALDLKGFQKYDYGEKGNMERYGQPFPPSYNLSRITAPIALFLGEEDVYCSKVDVDRAAAEMQNVVKYKYIPDFSHLDVLWGIDAAELIFKDIVELMKKYELQNLTE